MKGLTWFIGQPLIDRGWNQFYVRMVRDLMLQTCGEIVNNKDRMTLVQQVLDEMGSNESSTSGDKDSGHVAQATSE
jgi:hypothetical protein